MSMHKMCTIVLTKNTALNAFIGNQVNLNNINFEQKKLEKKNIEKEQKSTAKDDQK